MSYFSTIRVLLVFCSGLSFIVHAEMRNASSAILALAQEGPASSGEFLVRGPLADRVHAQARRLALNPLRVALPQWSALARAPFAYPELRHLAVEVLGELRSVDALPTLEYVTALHLDRALEPHLDDLERAELAEYAIEALGQIDDERATEILARVYHEAAFFSFKELSLRALARHTGARARQIIYDAYTEDAIPHVRRAAAAALARRGDLDQFGVELLRARTRTEDLSELRLIADALASACARTLSP